jgi:hypothetical protein
MHSEQAALAEFIKSHGGMGLITAANSLIKRVFYSAVSGTGANVPGHAAAQHSAPNRSLDALVIGLMREGIGNFTTGIVA